MIAQATENKDAVKSTSQLEQRLRLHLQRFKGVTVAAPPQDEDIAIYKDTSSGRQV